MRAASFDLDPALLAEMLHLPASATIFSAHSYITPAGRLLINVIAADPSLPEADAPHETTPTATKERVVWDWGVT